MQRVNLQLIFAGSVLAGALLGTCILRRHALARQIRAARLTVQAYSAHLLWQLKRRLRGILGISILCSDATAPSTAFIAAVLGLPSSAVCGVALRPMSSNGFRGEMCELAIEYSKESSSSSSNSSSSSTPQPPSLVLKRSIVDSATRRRSYIASASGREVAALCDKHITAAFGHYMPRVLYATGSYFSGECIMLMEDVRLRGLQPACQYLGDQWRGAPQAVPTDPSTPAGQRAVQLLADIFTAAAALHSKFWCAPALRGSDFSYLKGADWRAGRGRAGWEVAVASSAASWARVRAQIPLPRGTVVPYSPAALQERIKDAGGVSWCPWLVAVLDASYALASWESFQGVLAGTAPPTAAEAAGTAPRRSNVFTLTHGDWHAGNMLYRPTDTAATAGSTTTGSGAGAGAGAGEGEGERLCCVDWSEAAIWWPAAELAQQVISDVPPSLRRSVEAQLLQTYHTALVSRGVSAAAYPLQQLQADYAAIGPERWIWLLPLMAGYGFGPMTEYFAEQLVSFCGDHPAGWLVAAAGSGWEGQAYYTLTAVVCID